MLLKALSLAMSTLIISTLSLLKQNFFENTFINYVNCAYLARRDRSYNSAFFLAKKPEFQRFSFSLQTPQNPKIRLI
jgi:tRNA A37 threonylcarbamoyladenosine modification protein TsaB